MPTSSHASIAKIQTEVREVLPRLSVAQAHVLGEMVYAMLMVDGCGMTRMCSFLSELFGKSMNTLRQKYREMYYEKEAKAGVKKRGSQRREIVVEDHFADLLRGVLRRWQGPKILVLALDGSTLSDRLDILSISVVTRGCGIRVAWTILPGHQEGEWRPHWERMLRLLAEAVPSEWQVLVMADRGLYAAWLFESIRANGWHPFLRVKKNLTFRQEGEEDFESIGQRVKKPGRRWKGQGEWSETGVRMKGTLVVRWETGYEEPICVVTDLVPAQAQAAWYQMRFWIEDEYKDGKRGWFHWEHTKMIRPERASRLWLVLGMALQMAILLGSELEAREQSQQARCRRRQAEPRRRGRPALPVKRPRGREQSVLMRGIMALRAAESGSKKVLPAGQLRTEALPKQVYPVSRVPKSYQLKKQRREEKKRHRARAKTRSKRTERVAEKAAQEAEVQVRKQAQLERRAVKEARTPASQPLPLVRLLEKSEENRGGSQEAAKAMDPQPLQIDQQLSVAMREAAEEEPSIHRACQRPLPSMPQPEKRVPLLRLSRGCLQPPHRPLHTKIRHKEDHETACGGAP